MADDARGLRGLASNVSDGLRLAAISVVSTMGAARLVGRPRGTSVPRRMVSTLITLPLMSLKAWPLSRLLKDWPTK